jgi:2,3-bisphosphoglycerate-independent phosphoglycerate mutase
MSAQEVADSVIEAMEEDYDFILVNFANPDMVGHTGKLEAAKVAMQVVDEAIGRIYAHLDLDKRSLLICADHGNCEKMADEEGRPFTSHTSNPVYLVGVSENIKQLSDGALCDVAPTILALLQLEQPVEMTGKSLLN